MVKQNRKPPEYVQGLYKPRHPEKYKGNLKKIIYRSSLELQFMNWCDNSPVVVEWASEELAIQYIKPTDNKIHRYFIDFWIRFKTNEYEMTEPKWEPVNINEYSEKQQEQIMLIKEGRGIITPILGTSATPNPDIGKINSLYLCTETKELFIKKQGNFVLDKNGNKIKKTKKVLIEIKPFEQTKQPKPQQRVTESYKRKIINWQVNLAKWKTAEAFAEKHGMLFKVITEKWLNNNG